MKRILTTIQKRVNKILLLAVLAGAMASCDSVLDYNEGDCSIKYLVKFKYDYNMEKVDAFAQEVRTVTLYAFDDNGNMYNPQIQISAESETKRSIFREKDKTKRSKKESAQHSKSRNKSFVMTSVSAL